MMTSRSPESIPWSHLRLRWWGSRTEGPAGEQTSSPPSVCRIIIYSAIIEGTGHTSVGVSHLPTRLMLFRRTSCHKPESPRLANISLE